MAFVPYEHLTIDTALPLNEAVDRITRLVEPYQFLRFSRNHTEFQGKVTQQDFRITRIIHYRNSFIPIIKGRFVTNPLGTRIIIKMTLHPLAIAFMIFWMGAAGVMIVRALLQIDERTVVQPALAMMVFGYLLTTVAFKLESVKARKRLRQLFAEPRLS